MAELPDDLNSFRPPRTIETAADRFVDPRTFCRVKFSPMLATGVILGLIREHYGNPTAIADPVLQSCVWRSDDQTGILIETCTNDALSRIQMRPAVLVRRNAIQVKREGIGDEVRSLGPDIGGSHYVVTLHGSHTVFCISGKPGNVEALANETAMYLLQASPEIRGALCFKGGFKLDEIGVIGLLEGGGGQYVVPVTFSYITDFQWSIAPDEPVLRHIDVGVLWYPDQPLD
jgi:hypothetical protein